MSEIIITSQNLSRFSKRLQKSIEKQLGQPITLTQANLLLANTFGVDSIHHLQKKLESLNTKENLINSSTSEEKDIISFIESLFSFYCNFICDFRFNLLVRNKSGCQQFRYLGF